MLKVYQTVQGLVHNYGSLLGNYHLFVYLSLDSMNIFVMKVCGGCLEHSKPVCFLVSTITYLGA